MEEVSAFEATDAAKDAVEDAPLLAPTTTEHGVIVVDVA